MPTDEEHQLLDIDLESEEEDYTDEPYLGAEVYGPKSFDDMDELWPGSISPPHTWSTFQALG